jgi:hypothetical protein
VGYLTDVRVLQNARQRVGSNKRGFTTGVDGMTVALTWHRGGQRHFVDLQEKARNSRKIITGEPGNVAKVPRSCDAQRACLRAQGQHTMVAAAIRQAFNQTVHDSAVQTWRHVVDQRRTRWPHVGTFMDDAEADVLANSAFPAQDCTRRHSTDEIDKRSAAFSGIFPNVDSVVRLLGAVLLKTKDEWQLQHRYMQGEAMAEVNTPASDDEKPLQITPKAA